MFKVVGGVYTSTEWDKLVPGEEESYGPFESYDEARKVWHGAMFSPKLDNCNHRLFIEKYVA